MRFLTGWKPTDGSIRKDSLSTTGEPDSGHGLPHGPKMPQNQTAKINELRNVIMAADPRRRVAGIAAFGRT